MRQSGDADERCATTLVAATTPATAAERRTHAFSAVVSSTDGDISISDTLITFDVMLSAAGDEMLQDDDITTTLLATAITTSSVLALIGYISIGLYFVITSEIVCALCVFLCAYLFLTFYFWKTFT